MRRSNLVKSSIKSGLPPPQQARGRNDEQGFTLLELSIVIIIISLMIAGIVSLQSKKIRAEKMAEVERKMDVIEKALLDFRIANNRLPCPALNTVAISAAGFGVEARTAGVCDTVAGIIQPTTATNILIGAIPVRTLGLSDEDTIDPWGNRLKYAVHRSAATANALAGGVTAFSDDRDPDMDGLVAAADQMIIRNPDNTAELKQNVLVSIISHGPNGYGAYSSQGILKTNSGGLVSESQNCFCDNTGLLPATYTTATFHFKDTASQFFDDILRYYTDDYFFDYDEKHQF